MMALERQHQCVILRTIAQLLLSLVFADDMIAVGIFSSYVVSSTNLQVLVDSPKCAPFNVYNL